MPSDTEISVARLSQLVGTPAAPIIVDVRSNDDVLDDPRSLPADDHRDARAVFLCVDAAEGPVAAETFGATPFAIDGVLWSHGGERRTFDTMRNAFGRAAEALARPAAIVRADDTDRHDLAPRVAGLLAASLGPPRMYRDDLQQLDAGAGLYDAHCRWCRDVVEATHDRPADRRRK